MINASTHDVYVVVRPTGKAIKSTLHFAPFASGDAQVDGNDVACVKCSIICSEKCNVQFPTNFKAKHVAPATKEKK